MNKRVERAFSEMQRAILAVYDEPISGERRKKLHDDFDELRHAYADERASLLPLLAAVGVDAASEFAKAIVSHCFMNDLMRCCWCEYDFRCERHREGCIVNEANDFLNERAANDKQPIDG